MRHREELAQSIARLIVSDNMPWTLARERVMQASSRYANMPNAAEIESAVRENFSLFKPEKHAQSLLRKRRIALDVLHVLKEFDAYLAGAVLNGAAHDESNIRIEVFCDDVKAVEVALMDRQIEFDAIDPEPGSAIASDESLGLLIPTGRESFEGVRIEICSTKAKRSNPYKSTPDAWQQPWEAAGRIDARTLSKVLNI